MLGPIVLDRLAPVFLRSFTPRTLVVLALEEQVARDLIVVDVWPRACLSIVELGRRAADISLLAEGVGLRPSPDANHDSLRSTGREPGSNPASAK